MRPEPRWTSLVFFDNVRTPKHRDVRNSADANLILPLTAFEGGDIFVCHPDGSEHASFDGMPHKGYSLSVSKHPCLLPARDNEHFTLPWSGRRLVLVAFTVALHALVDESSRLCLSESGFRLPAPEFPPEPPPALPKSTGRSHGTDIADAVDPLAPFLSRPEPTPCLQLPSSAAVPNPNAPSLDLLGGFLVELCAGSARLSRIAQESSINAVPIDWAGNRHVRQTEIRELGLTSPESWQILKDLVKSEPKVFIFGSPPCGTCSAARQIPMPDGSAGPPVLRTLQFPWGLPDLIPSLALKVRKANQLYSHIADFLWWAHLRQIPWMLENPTNSIMWAIPVFHRLIDVGYFSDCELKLRIWRIPTKEDFLSRKQPGSPLDQTMSR